ncbi:MAG: 5'-nucleotidase C-terminal domain-containing protein [Bacteroidales bacterium]|nr:5'-nucleotidase C-terminal domain-containing protein [Bacteroidales bacterium]
MKYRILLAALLLTVACSQGPKHLTVLTTDDVHGAWFDSTYTGSGTRNSLLAVNYYVDSVRRADGKRNVLLLDAGDCLQGDNAAYYYNYVDTVSEHLFSRLAAYMRYDAITMGNHDCEAGPAVYRRVEKELSSHGIPFLAGNAVSDSTGMPVFQLYKVFRRGGMKVLVLGYQNPNIPAWLGKELWPDMHFESLIPLVQNDVDALRAVVKPDVTIVCAHSGTGKGDGKVLEDQALDLLQTLHGVDFVVCAHDHRQTTICRGDSTALINTGSRSSYLGMGKVEMSKEGAKKVSASLIKVDKAKADPVMRKAFQADFDAVKAFSNKEIGMLGDELLSRDAFKGRCAYMDLLHRVELDASGAQISFAAPLKINARVPAGMLCFNDLFTIYPFENQLFVLRMTGKEIKDYLEFSYGSWLAAPGSGHALAIQHKADPRYGRDSWSFVYPSYNFDSAAGLNYTVDLRKPAGSRVKISSLAGGKPFSPDAEYTVAMTSYRANGGGALLTKGAGIPKAELDSRVVGRYREIREYIKEFIEKEGVLNPASFPTPAMGDWRFVPDDKAIEKDMQLLF